MKFVNIEEMERAARERLPRMVYDYYAAGADDELSLADARAAYRRIRLYHRVLTGVGRRDLSTRLFDQPLSMPLLLAPTAFHRMAHDEGEVASARAAAAAETVMILSTLSTCAIEDVVAAAPGRVWFQLYVYRDRAITEELVARAEAAGTTALVLTVDAAVWGKRERDIHNNFTLPKGLKIRNLAGAGPDALAADSGSNLTAYIQETFKLDLGWDDVDWLCGRTKLPVLIKGVAHPDDARPAADHGVAGVVVSNHGGRQLDTTVATIDALPAIVEAVDGAIPVLVDGGIRRGTDIVKALARGAAAVAVGRPVLWGLAVGGQDGVGRALALLRDELDAAMGLCGCRTLADIGPELIA